MRLKLLIRSMLLTSLAIGIGDPATVFATECTHYASPAGTGSGLSASSPFRIYHFWSVAKPGATLCLLDGVYTDTITPPQNLSGNSSARITIRALNDGKVRINGQGLRRPVSLVNNDYFLLEGFNANHSVDTVVLIGNGADHNIVRRVVGWDGNDVSNIFGAHGNTNNLLEDVAGFGTARKIFSGSQAGNNLNIRRAFAILEKTTNTGDSPKMAYTLVYNNYNQIFENVIGMWNEKIIEGSPYGLFASDGITSGSNCVNSKYLGSIGLVRPEDKVRSWLGGMLGTRSADCIEFKDVVMYIAPGTHTNLRPIYAMNFDGGSTSKSFQCPVCNRRFTNTTEIGGATSTFSGGTNGGNGWTVTNRVVVQNVSAAPNIFNGSGTQGARVCKRYIKGNLTGEPLWPWPMNRRIIDAMLESGRNPVDVTATVERIFGTIPPECKASGGTSSQASLPPGAIPSGPTNLIVTQ